MANYISQYSGTQIDTAVGKIIANGEQAGKVLTSDGNGSSTWAAAPSGGTEYTGENGIYVNQQTGKIGISQNGVAVDRLARPSSSYAYPILTATPSSNASWANLEYEGVDIKSSAAQSGLVLTTDGNGGAEWMSPASVSSVEGVNVKSTGVSQQKYLRSNGTGGATWEDLPHLWETSVLLNFGTTTITNGYVSFSYGNHINPTSFNVNDADRLISSLLSEYGSGTLIPCSGSIAIGTTLCPVVGIAPVFNAPDLPKIIVYAIFNFDRTPFDVESSAVSSYSSFYSTRQII